MTAQALDVAQLADAMDDHKRRWAHNPEDGGTCGPWCAGDIAAAYDLPPALGLSARVAEVRRQQASGCGPVTAVMVSRSPEVPEPSAALAMELDIDRLAKALHDQGFGCNAYRCSLGRSADAHEQDARFLADAYREADR